MPDVPRHHRQMLLPDIGEAGQAALASAHVLVVGCGALGSVAIDQLARAGVGTLTLVDRDVVELTNLQRQTLYVEQDVTSGAAKADAAARRIRAIDSSLVVHPIVEHLSAENVLELMKGVTLVIDGLDNFPTRYLLNDACVKMDVPLIYGGAVATTGMSMTIIPGTTPCLRCVFPDAPPPGTTATCDTAGVLAAAVNTVASHQVTEAIKLIVGAHDALNRDLVSWDLWRNELRRMDVHEARRAECPCCGQREFPFLAADGGEQATTLCGRNAVQIVPAGGSQRAVSMDLEALAGRLAAHGSFALSGGLLMGTITGLEGEEGESIELTVFPDGRAIVRGSIEPEFARSVYARFVGQ